MTEQNRDPLTERIIRCSFNVHNALGPGFKESVYHKALLTALAEEKLTFETEKSYPIFYETQKVGSGRLDLVIENRVIVELKAVYGHLPKLYYAQTLSYLRASKLKTALLINFGNRRCDIKRFVL